MCLFFLSIEKHLIMETNRMNHQVWLQVAQLLSKSYLVLSKYISQSSALRVSNLNQIILSEKLIKCTYGHLDIL